MKKMSHSDDDVAPKFSMDTVPVQMLFLCLCLYRHVQLLNSYLA